MPFTPGWAAKQRQQKLDIQFDDLCEAIDKRLVNNWNEKEKHVDLDNIPAKFARKVFDLYSNLGWVITQQDYYGIRTYRFEDSK